MARMGIWSWNPSSGEMSGSQEFYRIFGIDPAKTNLAREIFLQRIHPEDRSTYEQKINAAVAERGNWELDYRILLPDGSLKHIHGIGRPVLSKSGEILQFNGTTLDITDRKQAEEELRRLSRTTLTVARRRAAEDRPRFARLYRPRPRRFGNNAGATQ